MVDGSSDDGVFSDPVMAHRDAESRGRPHHHPGLEPGSIAGQGKWPPRQMDPGAEAGVTVIAEIGGRGIS
jgi:hypothetical protein